MNEWKKSILEGVWTLKRNAGGGREKYCWYMNENGYPKAQGVAVGGEML